MVTSELNDKDVQKYPTAITNLQLKTRPVTLMTLNYCGTYPPTCHDQSSHRSAATRCLIVCTIGHIRERTQLISRNVCGIASQKKQVNQWAKECLVSQRSKIQRHINAPPEIFDVHEKRFSHIHVDLVELLSLFSGFTYLFTIIDRYTCWPEEIPQKDPPPHQKIVPVL